MSDTSSPSSAGRSFRRLAPVAVVGALALALVAAVVLSSGGDDEEAGPEPVDLSSVDGVITFGRAEELGLEIEWAASCDTETGRIAIPSNFAAECVAPFEGDNGGATANGVTGDTIRVVYYVSPEDPFVDMILNALNADDTDEEALATLEGFVELYSAYYETYGRRIELIPFDGSATSLDEVAARADAETIAEDLDPFMVWGGPYLTDAFASVLAEHDIIHLSIGASFRMQYYADHAPYLWSVLMSPDQTQTHLAEYVGRRLAGQPAIHAGDPDMQTRERVFGRVMLEIGPDIDYIRTQFEEELATYGVELAADVPYAEPITLETVVAQKIAELKAAGVTTVLFIGDPLAPATFTEEATAQEYFPEWIVPGTSLVDATTFARQYDQEQWSHAFGVSSLWARGRPEATWAYGLYEWYFGSPPPADNGAPVLFPLPTFLFAGVHAAGPDLNAETFRAGLFAAPPVPGSLTNPSVSYGQQGRWPFDDYLALDDMTELWWDPDATGPDERGIEGQGMYQYVDGGARYLPGEWPDTAPHVFDLDGAVALYETLPETDAAGDYPSPAG